jgi:glycosyltransferase involved in cell wall biosynthesis
MLKDRNIIIFGDDWGRHPSTIQHITRILAKSNRILWVSSLGLRKPHLKIYDIKRIVEKIKKMVSPVPNHQTDVNIFEIHPLVFPFYDIYIIRKINTFLLRKKIQRKMIRLNFSNALLLISTPIVSEVVGTLGESSSYYLCFDDYGRFDNVFSSILDMERLMLSRVDGCFAISDVLQQSRQCRSGENYYLPQGVDIDHFQRTSKKIPERMKNIKNPIVGFFGLISTWVDVDLVYECAKAYPSVSFVLIGRASVDLTAYSGMKNFFYLGEVQYEHLPDFAQSFDVGIVPFFVNELTIAANPIKILEYLAMGLPVVSTNLPEARKFGDCVLVAGDNKEFVTLIKIALEKNGSSEKRERQLKARQYSWTAVCELLSQRIQQIEKKNIGKIN